MKEYVWTVHYDDIRHTVPIELLSFNHHAAMQNSWAWKHTWVVSCDEVRHTIQIQLECGGDTGLHKMMRTNYHKNAQHQIIISELWG